MSSEPHESSEDGTDLETIAQSVEDLLDTTARLEELGAEVDLPVVERTARRIRGVAAQLDENLPEELYDD